MNNYVQPGNVLTLTAPMGGVTKGTPVKIGSLVVVPTVTALVDEPFAGAVVGVFELAKTSAQAWTEGQKIYWDASPPEMTTSSGGNTLVGVAVKVADNPSSTGFVRLDGVAR